MSFAPTDAVTAVDAEPDRRARMIGAMRRLLRERPAHAIAMDEVARGARVGKATVYRYFASKDQLVAACLDEALGELERRLAAAAATRGTHRDRLRAVVAVMVEVFARDLLPLEEVTRRGDELHGAWRRTVHDARSRLVAVLRRHFDEGRRAGVYRSFDAELTAHLAMGMIRSAVTHVEGRTRADLVDEIANMLLARACIG